MREHEKTPYHIGGTHRDFVIPHGHYRLGDASINAIAGACAGLVSSVATCPLDVVKTRLQAQHNPSSSLRLGKTVEPGTSPPLYRGILHSLRRIWIEEGTRGLYRGLGPVLLGYLPTWATYFAIYQHCRQIYGTGQASTAVLPNVGAAMTAGAISTTLTNPIWVVKTRMMTQSPTSGHGIKYKSTLDAFVKMFREEGIGSFYKGLGPSFFGIAHVAVQFPLYEKMKDIFGANGPNAHVSGVLLASSLSKMVASATTYPHEVLRTRLQNQRHPRADPRNKYHGIIHAAKTLYKEEGWSIFYTGMGTNLVRTVPASALTLVTFELVSSALKPSLSEDYIGTRESQ